MSSIILLLTGAMGAGVPFAWAQENRGETVGSLHVSIKPVGRPEGAEAEIKAGETVTYRVDWSCADAVKDCEGVVISVPIPKYEGADEDSSQGRAKKAAPIYFDDATASSTGVTTAPAVTRHLSQIEDPNGAVTWPKFDSVKAGTSGNMQVTFRTTNWVTPNGSVFTPQVKVTGKGVPEQLVSAQEAVRVTSVASLKVGKISLPNRREVPTGTEVTYQIYANDGEGVSNQSIRDAVEGREHIVSYDRPKASTGILGSQNQVIVDKLPDGAEFVRASKGGRYDHAARTVTFPGWDAIEVKESGVAYEASRKAPTHTVTVRYPGEAFNEKVEVVNNATLTSIPFGSEDRQTATDSVKNVVVRDLREGEYRLAKGRSFAQARGDGQAKPRGGTDWYRITAANGTFKSKYLKIIDRMPCGFTSPTRDEACERPGFVPTVLDVSSGTDKVGDLVARITTAKNQTREYPLAATAGRQYIHLQVDGGDVVRKIEIAGVIGPRSNWSFMVYGTIDPDLPDQAPEGVSYKLRNSEGESVDPREHGVFIENSLDQTESGFYELGWRGDDDDQVVCRVPREGADDAVGKPDYSIRPRSFRLGVRGSKIFARQLVSADGAQGVPCAGSRINVQLNDPRDDREVFSHTGYIRVEKSLPKYYPKIELPRSGNLSPGYVTPDAEGRVGSDYATVGFEVTPESNVEFQPLLSFLLPEGISWKGSTAGGLKVYNGVNSIWGDTILPASEAEIRLVDNFRDSGRQLVRVTWPDKYKLARGSELLKRAKEQQLNSSYFQYAFPIQVKTSVLPMEKIRPSDVHGRDEASVKSQYERIVPVWMFARDVPYDRSKLGGLKSPGGSPLPRIAFETPDRDDWSGLQNPNIFGVPNSNNYRISERSALVATKLVYDAAAGEWMDEPRAGQEAIGNTDSFGVSKFKLKVENVGNMDMKNLVLYDVLPDRNDTGVISANSPRGSDFPTVIHSLVNPQDLARDLGLQEAISVEYSASPNACRGEVLAVGAERAAAPHDCVSDWTTQPNDLSKVRLVRIDFGENVMSPATYWEVPLNVRASDARTGTSWNSFAYAAKEAATNTSIQPSEPKKVGIKIGADVGIVKTLVDNKRTLRPGDEVEWNITATNNGPGWAQGVKVSERMPEGWTITRVEGGDDEFDAARGLWTLKTDLRPRLKAEGSQSDVAVDAAEKSISQVTADEAQQPYSRTLKVFARVPEEAAGTRVCNFADLTLDNGASHTADSCFDIPEAVKGAISGNVFHDKDRDNTLGADEPRISDAEVELVNGNGEVIERKAVEADGSYSFVDQAMGDYTVRVVRIGEEWIPGQPDDDNVSARPRSVSLTPENPTSVNNDFPYYKEANLEVLNAIETEGVWHNNHTWTLTKAIDQPIEIAYPGDKVPAHYTVSVDATTALQADRARIAGTATLNNRGRSTVTLASLTATSPASPKCTVPETPGSIAPGASQTVTYECDVDLAVAGLGDVNSLDELRDRLKDLVASVEVRIVDVQDDAQPGAVEARDDNPELTHDADADTNPSVDVTDTLTGPGVTKTAKALGTLAAEEAPREYTYTEELTKTSADRDTWINTAEIRVSNKPNSPPIARATTETTVRKPKPSTISGTIYRDEDKDGNIVGDDPYRGTVMVRLLDEIGAPVRDDEGNEITTQAKNGKYSFKNLRGGRYQVEFEILAKDVSYVAQVNKDGSKIAEAVYTDAGSDNAEDRVARTPVFDLGNDGDDVPNVDTAVASHSAVTAAVIGLEKRGYYFNTYTWGIEKEVDKTEVAAFEGDVIDLNYSVTVKAEGKSRGTRAEVKAAVKVTNPGPVAVTVDIRPSTSPKALTCQPQTLTLQPGEARDIDIDCAVDAGALGFTQEASTEDLKSKLDSLSVSAKVSVKDRDWAPMTLTLPTTSSTLTHDADRDKGVEMDVADTFAGEGISGSAARPKTLDEKLKATATPKSYSYVKSVTKSAAKKDEWNNIAGVYEPKDPRRRTPVVEARTKTVATTSPKGAVNGVVFRDEGRDGSPEGDEPLRNVKLELLNSKGEVVRTTTTNERGWYEFTGLIPGSYSVRVTPPKNMEQTSDPAGTKNPKTIAKVRVEGGKTVVDQNFGFIDEPEKPTPTNPTTPNEPGDPTPTNPTTPNEPGDPTPMNSTTPKSTVPSEPGDPTPMNSTTPKSTVPSEPEDPTPTNPTTPSEPGDPTPMNSTTPKSTTPSEPEDPTPTNPTTPSEPGDPTPMNSTTPKSTTPSEPEDPTPPEPSKPTVPWWVPPLTVGGIIVTLVPPLTGLITPGNPTSPEPRTPETPKTLSSERPRDNQSSRYIVSSESQDETGQTTGSGRSVEEEKDQTRNTRSLLANTGANVLWLVVAGVLMIVVAALLIAGSRRRARGED